MILFIVIILFAVEARGASCQDHQIARCIETCKWKCKEIEIRPRVNDSRLLRVSYSECRNDYDQYFQESHENLMKALKTRYGPLAEFVLWDQKANDCEIDPEAQSSWTLIISKFLNYFFSLLIWKEKTHPSVSGEGIAPENLHFVKKPENPSDPVSPVEKPLPLQVPPSQAVPQGRIKQLLVPEYVPPEPPKIQDASPEKSQPVAGFPSPAESTSHIKELPQFAQVAPPA